MNSNKPDPDEIFIRLVDNVEDEEAQSSGDEAAKDEDSKEAILRDAVEILSYARYCLSRGGIEEACEASLEARDLFDRIKDSYGSAEARLLLGFTYYLQQQFKDALPMLASSQQQFAAVAAFQQQCGTLYLIAHCHLALGKPSKAIYSLNLAKKIVDGQQPEVSSPSGNGIIPDWQTLSSSVLTLLADLEKEHSQ